MQIRYSIQTFLLGCILVTSTLHASVPINSALDTEMESLMTKPTESSTVGDDGSVIEISTSAGTQNAAGAITKQDGSVVYFVRTSTADGSSSYRITTNGITSYATVDSNGVITGDASAVTVAGIVAANTDNSTNGPTIIITSEMVPGAECVCYMNGQVSGTPGEACKTGSVSERKYQCTIQSGLAGFQAVFAKIIRYVINIVLLLGVLAVVGLGIAWSFAGGDDVKMKSTLKTWAINIVVGLIILFAFRYILLFLAPWIYQ